MYVPQTSLTGFGDSVIVLTDNYCGYALGRFTGNARDSSESYEIRVENILTGEKHTAWFHKEDIYQNTEENLEKVKEITA